MSADVLAEPWRSLNRLAKWRTIFAGWQLGTRSKGDPECDAVRDHREVSLMLRAENNALVAMLVQKGVCTSEEWGRALALEAKHMNRSLEAFFPGMRATDDGIDLDLPEAAETMKRMNFKP